MDLVVNYDLSRQPFSVGDPINTAVGAAIVAGQRGCEAVHFVFTYDPSSPVVPQYTGITGDNLRAQMARRGIRLAPLVCPLVRAVSVMTHAQFSETRWDSWPEANAPYLFYRLNDDIIAPYMANGGRVRLTTGLPRPYFAPYVSVNLRQGETQQHRNSNLLAWRAFMASHPETTFHVIGDVDRTGVPRFCSLLDDLAVIEHSEFHMGTVSGPCEMARFGDKPYACFGPLSGEIENKLRSWDNNRWAWAKPGQNWLHQEETLENIEAQYQAWKKSFHVEQCPAIAAN